jgi:membrane-associated protease RseP (regulator of RpoE activity)
MITPGEASNTGILKLTFDEFIALQIKTFPPTLVPSILTGITSSVTSLKTPPKNLNAMFDFAIAGPLTGMAFSAIAIALGSQLTRMMDATTFPALPLEILRQSTLGGGIINNIIGSGVLNVPASALGTPGVAEMTVALHPLAVAGYIGLIVNALSLLPIGTTDGGRVALSVFGRQSKLAIGSLAFTVLLWFGVSGSDLFLYRISIRK